MPLELYVDHTTNGNEQVKQLTEEELKSIHTTSEIECSRRCPYLHAHECMLFDNIKLEHTGRVIYRCEDCELLDEEMKFLNE